MQFPILLSSLITVVRSKPSNGQRSQFKQIQAIIYIIELAYPESEKRVQTRYATSSKTTFAYDYKNEGIRFQSVAIL